MRGHGPRRLRCISAKFREGFEQRVSAYDYRRSPHVPPDFAEELHPADAAGPDVLSEEQARAAATADPSWAAGDIEIEQFDDFVRHRKRIRRFPLILQNDSTEAGAT